jgi:predicted SAM-dependent methyltransferase
MGELSRNILGGFSKELSQNLKNTKRSIGWQVKRKFGRVDQKIIDNYLAANEIRKLHIGCGENVLSDWLNSDYFPYPHNIFHLDATDTFPLANDTFDFIFSEHMIEHISHPAGLVMLSECYRVLRNKGKVRIATPNLSFLIDLYHGQQSELQSSYIQWATDTFIRTAPYPDAAFVINNFVRDWGHLFIYDEKTLRSSMEKAGFVNITRCELNKSTAAEFCNLENEARMPAGFLNLESVTLEGTKES